MRRDRALAATSALLFLACAAVTVWLCASMARGMPMPGGWTMSMAWMRMPGQSWLAAATMFVAMWAAMMVAMMMPSLFPSLSACVRFRFAAAIGYFLVWTLLGLVIYPIGVLLGMALMRSASLARLVPLATGVAVLGAGAIQVTSWKNRQLACCTVAPSAGSATPSAALRHGLELGIRCVMCCAGFMTILLVAGVMDLRVMAIVTLAITIERLAPDPPRVARILGILVIAAGALLIAGALTAR